MKKSLHEDWIAVIIAFLTIALVCSGLKPALPKFSAWADGAGFWTQISSPSLLMQTGVLFIWVLVSLVLARLLAGDAQPVKLAVSLLGTSSSAGTRALGELDWRFTTVNLSSWK
jgi:hypothetical protein